MMQARILKSSLMNSPRTFCQIRFIQKFERVYWQGSRKVTIFSLIVAEAPEWCELGPPAARTHARPLLQELHWLPIDSRIQYKLCTLMFDVQHGTAPVYLTELCEHCSDTRLRSSSRGDFCIPRTNLRLSEKAFSVAAPRACNSLPTNVRLTITKSAFCKHLKTHLFRVSYGHLS